MGILRVSGPHARSAVGEILATDPDTLEPRRATLSVVHRRDDPTPLDEAVVTLYPEPNSYTGETVVEISCHGSPVLLNTLLSDLIEVDRVRMARPGEFTRRAFENDKLDLAQADAVAGLIAARSEAALRSSARQLQGELSDTVGDLRETILFCRARIEATLDFSDEDSVGDLPRDDLLDRISSSRSRVDELLEEGREGQRLQQGCQVVLVGRPNVGKSSLLNRLLRTDRAIVTEQPGTTRDVVTDEVVLDGIPFRLHDTAGVRVEPDDIEARGISRSKQELERADLVLFLVDASRPVNDEDRTLADWIGDRKSLLVMNKIDLEPDIDPEALSDLLDREPDVRISARTGEGLDRLRDRIVEAVRSGEVAREDPLVTRTRHVEILNRCRDQLDRAQEGLERGREPELIAEDLREGADALAEITGEMTPDDVLDQIFSRFCIGK